VYVDPSIAIVFFQHCNPSGWGGVINYPFPQLQ